MVITMSEQGAALQSYNQELVKCIENLKKKSEALQLLILEEEQERDRLEKDVEALTARLAQVNENLSRNIAIKRDYDRTISESEAAYEKILESSQVLLNMLRREAQCLEKGSSAT